MEEKKCNSLIAPLAKWQISLASILDSKLNVYFSYASGLEETRHSLTSKHTHTPCTHSLHTMLTGPSAWNFIRFIFGSQNEQDHRGGLRYRRSPSLIAHFTADSARRNKRARLSLYINERKEDAWIWFIPGHLLQRWRNHSPRHDKCPSSVKYTKQRRLKREEV